MRVFCAKILLLLAILCPLKVFALTPEPRLTDDAQEQLAMKIFLEVRCLTCQGQVIENSDSEFAYEMRQLIRRKISENKNPDQIKDELVQQFGADILINPQTNKQNALLWILPLLFSGAIAIIFLKFHFSQNSQKQ